MSLKNDVINILGAIPLGKALPSVREHTTILDNTVISRRQNSFNCLDNFLNSKPTFYNIKIIQSGPIIEVKEYEFPVFRNWPPPKERILAFSDFDENGQIIKNKNTEERNAEYKKRNAYKSKNKIIRLASTNFKFGDKFLTLTFEDNIDFDVKNIEECNQKCTNFIRKLSRRFKNLKYIKVVQFQDKFDRGAVHFHLLCNLPYVHWKILTDLWGYGNIDIKRPKTTNEIAIYISKYMAKNSIDKRFDGYKRFSYSKNLKHPKVRVGPLVHDMVNKLEALGLRPNYESTYETHSNGFVKFRRYNVEDLPAHKDSS